VRVNTILKQRAISTDHSQGTVTLCYYKPTNEVFTLIQLGNNYRFVAANALDAYDHPTLYINNRIEGV